MLSRDSSLREVKALVRKCLNDFYRNDGAILERNAGRGVSERSIVFRFSHYLQKRIPNYFVDCDFNASFEGHFDSEGVAITADRPGKPILNEDGTETKRFVDIIVHKRDDNPQNNLICFEIKKWNNRNSQDFKKDEGNLRDLTSRYGYVYGFHLTIHKAKAKSRWTIFNDGNVIVEASTILDEPA